MARLAEFAEVAHRAGGVDAAKELARNRAHKQFDPNLAELLCAEAEMIFAGLDDLETWDAVINAEPALAVVLSSERFDTALRAIANFVDLKSPYSLGHSRAVADLAAAGAQLGLSEAERRTLRRAGLVHDFGRLGVSNAIWDKRGSLGIGDVKAGRLEADAVEAILGAAGHPVSRRRGGPAGLTTREIEVLRLLARGLSTRETTKRLMISPKTAGNHIEHIYSKIGASTRAAASLFAMRHGLLPEEEFATDAGGGPRSGLRSAALRRSTFFNISRIGEGQDLPARTIPRQPRARSRVAAFIPPSQRSAP